MDSDKNVHPTFANLAEEKQQAVLRAAIHEFARCGYARASMNVIVRQAGISKGSLYQYFPNKEALFLFVFARFQTKVKRAVKKARPGRDLFDHIGVVLRAGVAFIDQYPDYFQIYLRILFEPDVVQRQELLARVRLFSVDYFGPLCRKAQKEKMVREDISVEMMLFIVDGVIDRFLQTYARALPATGMLVPGDEEATIRQIDDLVRVLRQGLGNC